MPSRYVACSGWRMASKASFMASLLRLGLDLDDVVLHRGDRGDEVILLILPDLALVERRLQRRYGRVPLRLGDLHALVGIFHRFAGVLAVAARLLADLGDEVRPELLDLLLGQLREALLDDVVVSDVVDEGVDDLRDGFLAAQPLEE